MANRKNTFLIKRSNTPGKVPTSGDLLLGELALNTADVKLYTSGTTANSILAIGWDRIARTGDTMTGTLIVPYLSATTISATSFITSQGNISGNSITGNTFVINQFNGLTANTATTINLALSDQFNYTLSANTTFTFSNNANGKSWMVAVNTNPVTSGYTGSFTATTASIKWPYSITPVITPTVNKTDIFSFTQINGIIYGDYSQSY